MGISSILSVVGAVAGAAGSLASAAAQSKAAAYQAAVAKNNQQIEQYNAVQAANAGRIQAQQKSMKNAEQIARIGAALAAGNIDVNTGSAVDVKTSQREVGQLDAQTTMHNAELQVYGYSNRAQAFGEQAQLDTMESSQGGMAGILGAGGSVLGNSKAFSSLGGLGSVLSPSAPSGSAYTSDTQGASPY